MTRSIIKISHIKNYVWVKVYAGDGKIKKYRLPDMLNFGGTEALPEMYFFGVVDFRSPLEGEFFVSGAEPMAYKATSDCAFGKYLIVSKAARARA